MRDLTLNDIRAEYSANPRKFVRRIEKKLKRKVVEHGVTNDNQVYKQIVDALDFDCVHPLFSIEESAMVTITEGVSGIRMRIHNCVTIWLTYGAHLRFASSDEGLEITRLYVPPNNQGQGHGTTLMRFFLRLVDDVLTNHPPIVTEVTGAVGHGANLQLTPQDRQVAFFEKFEFKVYSDTPQLKKLLRIGGPIS